MGKKTFGTVLKVAAIVAIAYFAPAVAGKVLATTLGKAAAAKVAASAIGSTISSAAAGAALGEAGGAVGLGTNWQSGALAGGYGGYTAAKAAAANAAAAVTNPSALNPLAVTPTGATGSLGATLPGTTVGGAGLNSLAVTGTGATGSLGATLGGTTLASAPVTGLNATGVVTGLGTGTAAAGGAGLGGMLAAAPAGLKTVAPALLAAGLVGSGASAQMKAQQAELDKARASNSAFTQERFNQAQRLLGEADYLNPEYMGRQAGQAALIRGSIQETEGTRGLTGARRLAEQRRFRLGTSRNVGTAFQQGFGQGVTGRIQTRQAGIGAIPTAYPLTTSEGVSLEGQRIEERDAERKGVGLLLGQVLGVPPLTEPAALPG